VFLLCLANHPEVVWIQKKEKERKAATAAAAAARLID
jgi:hypothetical protein